MLLVCARCSTRFAVGLARCPNCTSTDHYRQGEEADMPKIHADGRVTDRTQQVEVEQGAQQDTEAPAPAASEDRDEERAEQATGAASPRSPARGPRSSGASTSRNGARSGSSRRRGGR